MPTQQSIFDVATWHFALNGSDTLLVSFCVLWIALIKLLRRHPKYPPGPKPLPIIGNMLDLPKRHQWLTFTEWGAKYGPLIHAEALGTHLVVINSAKIASDLLDKRSKVYSDRPTFVMAGELVGLSPAVPLIHFGPRWAGYRRLMAQFMGTRNKINAFEDLLKDQSRILIKKICANPERWQSHIRNFAGTIILLMTYGYETSGEHDRLITLIEEVMDIFNETTSPGAYSVDVFPLLRYIPTWFPGASWKKTVQRYRRTLSRARTEPYEWTKSNIATGLARPSFITEQLQSDEQLTEKREEMLQWTALAMYGGGADTTVCGFKWFVQAILRYPAEQHRAQDELDAVLGKATLPTCADRARLPCVEALYLETLRMFPILPLAIPHANTEDDVYEGYFIKKGSILFPNVWQFTRDPETYPDPLSFNPTRFFGPTAQRNPKDFVFGFGRRICPGMYLGDESMWLACASLLATFDVRPALDANGEPILPPIKDAGETINHPDPIACSFVPRI